MTAAGDHGWSPALYAEHARFVSDLGFPVVELLAPLPGERILDLGCGDGALTVKLAALGCRVVGVDASPEMVDAARCAGVDARVADGHALAFDSEFDAVFSNAALHWMTQPERVIDGVWRALVPGGRFAGEMGGRGNVQSIVLALEAALAARGMPATNPWFFPSADEYAGMLRARGFAVDRIVIFSRPTPLPGGMRGWLETFCGRMLASLPPAERDALMEGVVDALRPALCGAQGQWVADYVRLRFVARKPAA